MTFKDLRKKIMSLESPIQKRLEILRIKPFWIWNKDEHRVKDIEAKGFCCFNHIVGLPTKNKLEKPKFDYKKNLFDVFSPSLIHLTLIFFRVNSTISSKSSFRVSSGTVNS